LAGIPEKNGPISVMLQEHNIGRGYINEFIAGVESVVGHGVHEQYHELLKQFKIKYIDSTNQ